MLEFKNIYILGYSGHAFVVIDTALSNNFEIQGYFNLSEISENPYKLPYIGNENDVDVNTIVKSDYIFPATGSNIIRERLVHFIEKKNLKQTLLIAPNASISPLATIGLSTFIGPLAIVNSKAKVGKGCIINSGAVIEHECSIGNYSHVAPKAILTGNVVVGGKTFIGANAVIKQGGIIGNNVIIGAGSVVINNIPDNETWAGNPARRIG